MKAQLLSDLHCEFYYGGALMLLKKLEFEPDLDFLFLLGDVVVPAVQSSEECREIFSFLSTKARHCIYVIGNHEYYHSDHATTEEAIRSFLPENFVWLDNSSVVIDGIELYGGAMWFPDHPLNQLYEKELNDFEVIKDIHDWVYESNAEFRANAIKLVTNRTIVLSHHLPSHLSTPRIYAESHINRFFVSDESKLIMDKQPRLWVHGHTHHPCEYTLDKTPVVCNPLGYPAEMGCSIARPITKASIKDFLVRFAQHQINYPPVVFDISN